MASAAYPSDASLRLHLSRLVKVRRGTTSDVIIATREPLAVSRTHPSERVLCVVDGQHEDLFCKYGGFSDAAHLRHGHRHGTAYEAQVYRDVLQTLDLTIGGFLGAVEEGLSTWLVLDYLDGCIFVSRTGLAGSLSAAGRWLGLFHQRTAARARSGGYPFLHRHTADYYLGCAERTLEMATPLAGRMPWLAPLVGRYRGEVVPLLLDKPAAIHGEFYSSNVLYRDGVILPVDWESAAVGAPEIDLAFLLEGWPETDQAGVLEAYAGGRWPDGPPLDFRARLDAARMFSQFRWLGDRPEWTVDPANQWRFDVLEGCAINFRVPTGHKGVGREGFE